MQISWIFKSYFLIAGGFVLSSIFSALLGSTSVVFWLVMALGAALGGFFAGKASDGKTIAEPAIGGALFILSLVGTFYLTTLGGLFLEFVFSADPTALTSIVLPIVGASMVGALAGAFLGEKLQGDGGAPGMPFMIFLSALSVAGGLFFGFFSFALFLLQEATNQVADPMAMNPDASADKLATLLLIAPLVGSAIGGFSARRSGAGVLAVFLGALVFCGFLFLLSLSDAGSGNKDFVTGFVVISLVIAVCALIGAGLGSIGLKKTPPATA